MRIPLDEWGLRIAEATALRGTCIRRKVGAVITDTDGVILSTGYNGVPRHFPHCDEVACGGQGFASGTELDMCDAIHAEVNAITFVSDTKHINTIYVTVAPCVSCTKMLLATKCQRIVFRDDYANSGEDLWHRAGKLWLKYDKTT
jgi:dCMP deaminase